MQVVQRTHFSRNAPDVTRDVVQCQRCASWELGLQALIISLRGGGTNIALVIRQDSHIV